MHYIHHTMENFDSAVAEKKRLEDEDEDTPSDPPPAYEEAQYSIDNPQTSNDDDRSSLNQLLAAGPYEKHANVAGYSISRHSKPLTLRWPDPKEIRCCCGRYNDTTKTMIGFPNGTVLCQCGYKVNYRGYSEYFPTQIICVGPKCKRLIKLRLTARYVCACGIGYCPDGSVRLPKQDWKLDPTNVRCLCGAYCNTIRRCTVAHKDSCQYDYDLPKGTTRCACGRTVTSDGIVKQDLHGKCCRVRL